MCRWRGIAGTQFFKANTDAVINGRNGTRSYFLEKSTIQSDCAELLFILWHNVLCGQEKKERDV